jgi:hypothetical protein
MPLEAALSIAGMALARAVSELALSFVSIAFTTDFTCVLTLDFAEAFLIRFCSLCLLLFSADLCVAKNYPPLLILRCRAVFYMNSLIMSS